MGAPRQSDLAVDTEVQAPREKSIDDWLPVTASRKGKWWYSAFHNVNVVVGAGVLGLPLAMSELGWGPGVALLIILWVTTLYTLWLMVQMHEAVPGKRFNRFYELGQHAFGKKMGLWIVVPQQLLVLIMGCRLSISIGGIAVKDFHDIVCRSCSKGIPTPCFILLFGSVNYVLSHVPSLNSIWVVSLVGAAMSVSYSTLAWGASLGQWRQEDEHHWRRDPRKARTILSFFSAIGTMALAYGGHSTLLEIQATMPSTPEKPSKEPMWKGAVTAYIIIALCYFPVSIVGYWVFGSGVNGNIFIGLGDLKWVVSMANMMVAIHCIGSYQISAMVVIDLMEAFLTKELGFSPSVALRLTTRSIYVAFTVFAAIAAPLSNDLAGFFPGLLLAPANYLLPCIMWLVIYKPRRYSLSWFINWVCIIFGVVLIIISAIGGLWKIIDEFKTN